MMQQRVAALEAQLDASRQAHQAMIDMVDRIDDSFFAVDREWRYWYVNPAAVKVAGLDPADLLGKTVWEIFPQLLGTIHERCYRQAMAEQVPVHFEAPGITTGRWCEFSCYPSPDGLTIHASEITARKQAETEREAQVRLQAAVTELGQRALSRIDLNTLLQESVQRVADTLNVEYAKILERLPGGQSLLLRAGVGWEPAYVVGQTTIGAEFDSQSGYTLHTDAPVIVPNLRLETRFSGSSLLLDHGVISGVTVVIGGRQGPYGVLGVHTARARIFNQNEVDFLQAVVNVLAQAINRKQVEGNVREVASRLAAIVTTAVDGILTIDEGGAIESANPAVEAIFGYKPSELIGRNIRLLMPEPYHSEHDGYLSNYLRTGEAKIIGSRREVEGQRKDGSVFPLELAVSEVTLEGRRLFTGIVRDISERKQAEQALQESEDKFRAIFTRAISGIVLVDERNTYVDINPAMCRILGATREEILTHPLRFYPPGMETQQQEIGQQLQHDGYWHGEFPLLNVNEELVELEWWVSDLVDPPLRVAVINDITDRKRAEQERDRLLAALAQERERLKALTDTLEERVLTRTEQVRALAAELSVAEHEERKRIAQILHDYVQQMLYGVQMRMYLLASEMPDDPPANVQANLQEMNRLIEEAVQAVRTLSVELTPPALREEGLAEAMAWMAGRMKELHGLQVAVDVQGDCQVADFSLRLVLFQIVQELLFNVVKHAETDQAAVTLAREGERLDISVRDEGKGFNTAAVAAHKDTHTGLGLSSIQERLALFGGEIQVCSKAGVGTLIRIVVPLR